jgi:type II secretory pathway pseudopilin PulG
MRPAKRQSGAIALILVIVVVALLALLISSAFLRGQAGLDQERQTKENFRRISDALVAFASLNRRLPCPAQGSDATGSVSAPVGSSAACTDDAGVVPWSTLSLRKEDALDGWGRKISYRVYSGTSGFTQANGVSMTDCNTNASVTSPPPLAADGKCWSDHTSSPAQFLAGKGLSVDDLGTPKSQLAFVLISHGESGQGAYGAEAAARNELPAGTNELVNTQSTPPYWILARTDASVALDNAAHFDDALFYMTVGELVPAAKLGARDWGAPPPPVSSSQSFTHAAVANATGASFNFNTNASTVNFGASTPSTSDDFVVTTLAGNRNVAAGSDGGGNEGLGSILNTNDSNPAATISTNSGEGLAFTFTTPARYLGITLVDFGYGPLFDLERAQVTFYSGGSPVGSALSKTACNVSTGIANFTLSPGVDFDKVTLQALTTNVWGSSSNFLVGAIATCPLSSPACNAPGAVPTNNCP